LFDNVDKLYGNNGATTGTTETPPAEGGDMGGFGADLGGGAPPPPAEAPPAGGEGAVTPESVKKDMNIILERDNIYGVDDIDLEKGSRSLGVIEESLRKLID
jgi:hypothetical protein